MKTIGIITFHASHNYGSVLQAYALQTVVEHLGCDSRIIDYRNSDLRNQYKLFPKVKKIKNLLRNFIYLLFYRSLRRKHRLFEDFISSELHLTKRYLTHDELIEAKELQFLDAIITGSDQVWNYGSGHTDDAYFLDFYHGIKLAYAASFGPLEIKGDGGESFYAGKIRKYLPDFQAISLREPNMASVIQEKTASPVTVVPDPTLLLGQSTWRTMCDSACSPPGEYILFYSLGPTREMVAIARRFSKLLGIRVVLTNFNNEIDLFAGFERHFACGPREFLKTISNAKLVITSSFHATVFSILFQRPFFCVNGDKDNRIRELLANLGLWERSINMDTFDQKSMSALDIDYSQCTKGLEAYRNIGMDYLKDNLA